MVARHPMSVFAFAIALALVSTVVNSQALTPTRPPLVVISIQNNFTTYNLTVRCGSDIPAVVHPHVLLPKEVYMFQSDPKVKHVWACAVSTAKPGNFCSARYRGEFYMWQHDDLSATEPHLCSTNCPWFADESGLSLIQHPRGEPVHMYDWSTEDC